MNKKISAFLILFLVCGFAGAQRSYNFFYGKVVDASSGRGIPNVNIAFERSSRGFITDKKGDFSFYIDTIPLIMILSHVGYETRRVMIDKTSFSMEISMFQKIQVLPEVVVTGKSSYSIFFSDPHRTVMDYEPDSAEIFLLVNDSRSGEYELLGLDYREDTIARSGILNIVPKKLFHDCLGNIHLLCGDSAYQVYREKERIILVYPVSLKRFREALEECVLSTEEELYFRQTDKTGQQVNYFRVDRKSSQREIFSVVEDSLKAKMLRRNSRDYQLLMQSSHPEGREDFVDWSYIHKILYRPVSTSLCRVGNFICIFNTSDMTMEFYKMDGTFAYKLLLRTRNITEGTWSKEIYIDHSSSKVFTTFVKNGYSSLYRIDMNTGDLVFRLPVEHLFPEKIRIQNGYLFYLYHAPGSGDNRELFRQKL